MSTTSQLKLSALIRNSMLELILTSALLFGVTTFVRFVVGASPISRALPQIHVQLFLVGALVAVLLSALILSRPGKISGGHMNPAISLAMWRFGVFPAVGIVPYIAAQWLGSILGVLAAPMVGAELGAQLLRAFRKRRQVLTHRLCGTHPDGARLDDPLGEARPPMKAAA